MAYNIPRPLSLQPQGFMGGATPLLSGLQAGMGLAQQAQQMQANRQAQELNQIQLDQAQAAQAQQDRNQMLSSVAQGAEDMLSVMSGEGKNEQQVKDYLLRRVDSLASQGRDTSHTEEAVDIGLRFGFDSPQMQQVLQAGLQGANSEGVYTPKQQAQREAIAKAQADSVLSTKDRNKIRQDFRREFNTTAGKGLLESTEQIEKIRKAQKTGIGDVALMKTINKMIDSGIVTDSDFDQVAYSGGFADGFEGMFNKIIGGGSLNETTRKQIMNQAESLYGSKLQSAYDIAQGIEKDAGGYGVSDVIGSGFKKLFNKNKGLLSSGQTGGTKNDTQDMAGFVLMEDAQGNRAMVNPQTGEVREL